MRACLEPNVSKMMKGPVVVTGAWVADVVVSDMALSKNTADNPFPWTWALGRVATAAEAAGNGPGIDIDILGSMAVVAEDEGKVRMEDCALVGHWEKGWRVAPVVRWVGESSWSYGGRVKRLSAQQSLFLMSTWQTLSGTVISLWMRYIARDTLYVSLGRSYRS